MSKKNIVSFILVVFMGLILLTTFLDKKDNNKAHTYYEVYLNEEKLGIIDDEAELYDLINQNQIAIKYQYNVLNVYPPTNLKIVKTNTYSNIVDNVEDIYKEIEEKDNFAIKGYIIKIKNKDDESKSYTINVLDKEVFYNAAKRFVKAFLDEDEYDKYINNNQDEIIDTGRIIENMEFKEQITIEEGYIDVGDKIYTDELELSQFLLFGSNPDTKTYTIKLGDTIESVSDANKLNTEEFLVANTSYKSANTLLRVGDQVNVTLIEPQLTFIYDLYEVYDQVVVFQKETKRDSSKNVGFNQITTPGRNGLNRIKESYTVTNGERPQESNPEITVLREVQNQVTLVGTRQPAGYYIPENPVVIDGDWGWPTNQGYVITSGYVWRWGKQHQGIDISGAGNENSPIYAVADGTVISVFNGCPTRGKGYGDPCGGGMGNSVVIQHANGYYTRYAHLTQNVLVKVGQTVSRGQRIGGMGNSGSSTGFHLHFAVAQGSPTNYFDPMKLYGG